MGSQPIGMTDVETAIERLSGVRQEIEGVELTGIDALRVIGDTFGDRPFTVEEFAAALTAEARRRKAASASRPAPRPTWWRRIFS